MRAFLRQNMINDPIKYVRDRSTERLRDVAERMGIAYATAHRIRTGQAWREYGSPFAGLMR